MEWTKLTVRCLLEDLETVTAFMSMLDNGLEIEALTESIDRRNRRQQAGYGAA